MTKEAQIEDSFIKKLEDLKYTYRKDIQGKNALERNFREKFETLNRVKLTDNEFERLKTDIINPDVFNASKLLRTRNYFQREDGTPLHYTLVNIKDWCKNEYEVINQLRINTENSNHRYDVIILINGIPIVQIELKTLEISPRKAMQQIVDYKNDSGNGYNNSLLCFMQLFIVSNRTNTYYFANNRNQHFSFNAEEQFLPVYQYADEHNKKITHIDSFAEKFLPKCTLGELISKYMVLVETEQKMLVMRPYQIYAVKAIVDCIQQNRGNGYIWHTTGSRKKYKSYKGEQGKIAPNILQRIFKADRPNQKWVTDITEFKVKDKKLYLSPIMDLYNQEIISYELSERPVFNQVTQMLKKAFKITKDTKDLILHSDQGWQYQMKQYQALLNKKGIVQSMSRKGNCLDNAIIENFFGILKSELFYLQKFNSIDELKKEIKQYIYYYNNERIKSNLNKMSPIQYRTHFYNY